jgi:hypothetical protein
MERDFPVDISIRSPPVSSSGGSMKAYPKVLNIARIVRAYKAGKRVSEIARQAGYPRGHGQNRVRGLLEKAGVYKTK